MATRRTIKHSTVLLLLTTLSIALIFASSGIAANFPLEIINIKPAGTGSPAIPSTNRIFWAYPGIEYNIRAAVIGGLYPFTYTLSNAPSGMAINSKTGEISWPNPQTNSGTITLSVTDAENNTVNTSWAIAVSTSGFLFVNGSYSGIQTGSITQPYNSLGNMLSGSRTATSIVYFRSGSYSLVEYNPTYTGEMFLRGKPHTWLAFPGETVKLTGETGVFIRSDYGIYDGGIYLDNLKFSNFTNLAMMLWGGHHYQTIRRCVFDNIMANSSVNNNYGFIYTTKTGDLTYGHYFVIQDSDFSHWKGASGIGSIYSIGKALIENNYFHDTNGDGLSGINNSIGLKAYIYNLSIRGNKAILDSGLVFGTNMNSQFAYSDNVDVSFNYFNSSTANRTLGMVHGLNGYGGDNGMPLNDFFYYRNTVIGDIGFSGLDGTNCAPARGGPFTLYNNVFINPNTDVDGYRRAHDYLYYGWDGNSMATEPWKCINDYNNLKRLPEDNVVDINGNLTSKYSSYIGTHGYQTRALPRPPSGIKIISQ